MKILVDSNVLLEVIFQYEGLLDRCFNEGNDSTGVS